MPDIFSQRKRSEVMARIRGVGKKDTELRMIGLFRSHDITGWRVLRIWEHALTKRWAVRTMARITRSIRNPN